MSQTPAFPCSGGCQCGAVRYRLLEDAVELHTCHCTDCQTITGSAFAMSMVVKRSAVELTRGTPERIEYVTTSGIRRVEQRCTTCGVRLWGEPHELDALLVLRPGTLDDTRWCEPVAHIWTRSAQPWVTIPEHALNRGGDPDPDEQLASVRAWRGRASAPGRS